MNALSGLEAAVGKEMLLKIQSAKILLVGSGGIGCELLKNLALSGFRHVEVIDLDTIDVSNLNRQFLFRSQHVGQPKCHVACEVSRNMIPFAEGEDESSAAYTPHHGNVCDNSKFNVQYVAQFALVLNALDNVTARRRVNRLCLAANVPLIEAGTTGYLGQVKVIHKASNLACYECVTQEAPKVYPICTIRSTPSQPVHCIVWAKELYKLLFGPKPEDSMLHEGNGDEPSTYMDAVDEYRKLHSEKKGAEDLAPAARLVLEKLFLDEIQKQLDMGRYKTAKKTPTTVAKDVIVASASISVAPSRLATYQTTDVWSQEECVAEFVACLVEAAGIEVLLPAFDKDDPMAIKLVTACANLRSQVFSITPLQSEYSTKGIAGNIIPAIATTNAIVAGLQVLQAFSILEAQIKEKPDSLKECCRYIDCVRNKTGRSGLFLLSSTLPEPNQKCFVCRNANISLTIDVNKWTLQALLDRILKSDLGFEEPTVMLEGDIIHEEGEDADTDIYEINLPKLLSKLPCGGIVHGTVIRVEDFSQDLEVDLCVTHKEEWTIEEGEDGTEEKYTVGGEKPAAKIASAAMEGVADDDDDDVLEVFEAVDDQSKPAATATNGKRKSEGETEGEGAAKKAKTVEEDDDVIFID